MDGKSGVRKDTTSPWEDWVRALLSITTPDACEHESQISDTVRVLEPTLLSNTRLTKTESHSE